MRVISYNVNSLRVRLLHLSQVIQKHQPDIIGLQETKVSDDEFPIAAIQDLGYEVAYHGQKTHYGVALLCKKPPVTVRKGFIHDDAGSQKRLIAMDLKLADGGMLTVVNGYFPQGENRTHPQKFPSKVQFYADLTRLLQTDHSPADQLLVMGDMNVAPTDLDVGIGPQNMKRWLKEGKCCFLPEEREMLANLMDWGLTDTFRHHHPEINDLYSWFDYRSKGFDAEPKRGIRIDHILATAPMLEVCESAGIDYDIRGLEKPSDHCPVWSDFNLALA